MRFFYGQIFKLNDMKMMYVMSLILVFSTSFLGCKKDDSGSNNVSTPVKTFGIFTVQDDQKTIHMEGVINSKSFDNFKKLMAKYPNVEKINIVNCDGSMDDETNLKLSKDVHTRKLAIHLLDDGLIASGGVDFYLAGIKRTKGNNTRVGVHSWGGDNVVATDFPKGHEYHLPYIEYYKSVGFTQQEAEDFYYFTIHAVGADDIHWMTDAELAQYKIVTD